MHNIFPLIVFYRIMYDPFCSIKIKITTFDRLGFMFVYIKMHRCKRRVCKRKTLFGQLNTYNFEKVLYSFNYFQFNLI